MAHDKWRVSRLNHLVGVHPRQRDLESYASMLDNCWYDDPLHYSDMHTKLWSQSSLNVDQVDEPGSILSIWHSIVWSGVPIVIQRNR